MMENVETPSLVSIQPIERVKFLCAEIGARGPTTDEEAKAAAYAAAQLEEIGARDVSAEIFRSVPSLYRALEIALLVELSSTILFLVSGGGLWICSVVLCLISLVLMFGEFSFWKFSLSSLLPKRISQNVFGKIPPAGEVRKKLVFIGHLDTNRTPKLFHPRIIKYLSAILLVSFACVIIKMPVFAVGALIGLFWKSLLAALVLDLPLFILLVTMIHGDFFTPFTEGANDNATGAAVALSMAEFFSRNPLAQTEVWTVCTGCEEAALTGIKAFLKRHGDQLKDACFIDLECLGIGKLRYITQEGMLKKYHSNPGLLQASAVAAERIGGGICAAPLKRGYTETAIVLGRGLKGLTIMAFPEGSDEVPHWHQLSDRIENINPENLTQAVDFLAALAKELDAD